MAELNFQVPGRWPKEVQRARRSVRGMHTSDLKGRVTTKEVSKEVVKVVDKKEKKAPAGKQNSTSAKRRLADKFANLEAEEEKALQDVQAGIEPQEELDMAAFYGYENQTPTYLTGNGLYLPTPRVVIHLTKEEIDEDFRIITGRPPPRRGRRTKHNGH